MFQVQFLFEFDICFCSSGIEGTTMSAPIGAVLVSSTNANHALILEAHSSQDVKADELHGLPLSS